MIVALDTQLAVGTATGIGVYARDLRDALRARGVDVRALSLPALDPWRFDRRVLWDQVLLPAALARSGANVFHATAGTLPFVRALPTVVTVHDMAWLRVQQHTRAYARAYFGALMKRAYRAASLVVVDSRFSQSEYAELSGDPRPATVVYPGVDARFNGIVRRPDAQPFALVTGTVEARKNLMRALDVAAAIPELRIVSIGPPTSYTNAVLARAAELGVRDRLELRGYVDRATVDDLYARAALALVPSRYEGFGYAVAEARCAGVPFVAARTSSLVEVADDDEALADVDDLEAWIVATRSILNGRDAAEQRAESRRASAHQRFDWAQAAALLETLYARVVH
ncbi:MAG: glycosyltransferase family 1 protein [Candidatus Velthaea sp.]